MQIDHPDQQQCRRDGCACTVESGQEYCSDACRAAAHDTPVRGAPPRKCECGHDPCNRNDA